jgi:7-cyano-7-deazaguanine reductase
VQIILQRCGSSFAEHDGQKLAGVSSRSRAGVRATAFSGFAPTLSIGRSVTDQRNVAYNTSGAAVEASARRAPRRGVYNSGKENRMAGYTDEHARAGIRAKLPELETWPNQFPGYRIVTRIPEYTSICPKTGMPDYGAITIEYEPRKLCIELKSLKLYMLAYRNLGIFYENAVNRILRDIVEATRPVWCSVRGDFTPRGGLTTSVEARWPRKSGR